MKWNNSWKTGETCYIYYFSNVIYYLIYQMRDFVVNAIILHRDQLSFKCSHTCAQISVPWSRICSVSGNWTTTFLKCKSWVLFFAAPAAFLLPALSVLSSSSDFNFSLMCWFARNTQKSWRVVVAATSISSHRLLLPFITPCYLIAPVCDPLYAKAMEMCGLHLIVSCGVNVQVASCFKQPCQSCSQKM